MKNILLFLTGVWITIFGIGLWQHFSDMGITAMSIVGGVLLFVFWGMYLDNN